MPECPNCGTTLGMYELGFICPNSKKLFTYAEAEKLDGFDWEVVNWAYNLFEQLQRANALRQGANHVEFTDDAMIITRLGDLI